MIGPRYLLESKYNKHLLDETESNIRLVLPEQVSFGETKMRFFLITEMICLCYGLLFGSVGAQNRLEFYEIMTAQYGLGGGGGGLEQILQHSYQGTPKALIRIRGCVCHIFGSEI